jgi:hypothetical protein
MAEGEAMAADFENQMPCQSPVRLVPALRKHRNVMRRNDLRFFAMVSR